MKARYRLFRRRGNVCYLFDNETGKQTSLKTKNRKDAEAILRAKNEALHQPLLNLEIARAYAAAADPEMTSRTWKNAFEAIVKIKSGPTKVRWERAAKDRAIDRSRV